MAAWVSPDARGSHGSEQPALHLQDCAGAPPPVPLLLEPFTPGKAQGGPWTGTVQWERKQYKQEDCVLGSSCLEDGWDVQLNIWQRRGHQKPTGENK